MVSDRHERCESRQRKFYDKFYLQGSVKIISAKDMIDSLSLHYGVLGQWEELFNVPRNHNAYMISTH